MKQLAWGLVMATGKAEKISSEIETAFLYLNDRPVLAYSLAAFMQCPEIEGVVVCVSRERAESVLGMVQMYGFSKVKKIVAGMARRSGSMATALGYIDDEADWVCVHDASRPFVTPGLIGETVKCARRNGSGVAAVEIPDVVVDAKKGAFLGRMQPGGTYCAVVSPQTYARKDLMAAYPATGKDRKNHTDDLEAMLSLGLSPRFVSTGPSFRIRSAEDLAPALALMK